MVVGSNQYAARWTVGTGWISLGDLAGGSVYGAPEAMSSDGSVIVGLSDSSLGTQAFLWTKETGMNGLGFLSDSHNYSKANAISADGSIVVGQSQSASNAEAFIWTPEWGMRSLKDVLSDTYGLDVTGWYFSQAVGISADGTRIVGNGISPDGVNTAFLVTIPEPTVLSTLAIGIGWGLKRHS